MKANKLIIAAAGSGKTTFLVNEALLRDRHFVSRLDKIISRSRTGKLVR